MPSLCFTIISIKTCVCNVPSCSAAAAAATNNNPILNRTVEEYGICSHYLAVTLYDAWTSTVIDRAVDTAVENFQRVLSISNDPMLLSYEKTYTSCLSVVLGELLQPYKCLHQPSLKHKSNDTTESESIPDFYCTLMSGGIPSTPLVVADFKTDEKDFNQARSQSFGYAQDVMTFSKSERPIVAMPGTRERFALYLCFSAVSHGPKLIPIKIGEASVEDSVAMKCFFRTLKCAVGKIACNKYSGIFTVQSKEGLHLKASSPSCLVFFLHQVVYKLYNLNQLTPRIDVMNKISQNYFEMTEHKLSEDGMIVYYTSRCIKQKKKDELKLDDFRPILYALDQLHENNYVHSDVQVANILFPCDGDAKLIDFDLAGKVNTAYPVGYNNLSERHPDAKPNVPRLTIHDRYSIAHIIKNQKIYSDFTERQKGILSRIQTDGANHIDNQPLLEIYQELIDTH